MRRRRVLFHTQMRLLRDLRWHEPRPLHAGHERRRRGHVRAREWQELLGRWRLQSGARHGGHHRGRVRVGLRRRWGVLQHAVVWPVPGVPRRLEAVGRGSGRMHRHQSGPRSARRMRLRRRRHLRTHRGVRRQSQMSALRRRHALRRGRRGVLGRGPLHHAQRSGVLRGPHRAHRDQRRARAVRLLSLPRKRLQQDLHHARRLRGQRRLQLPGRVSAHRRRLGSAWLQSTRIERASRTASGRHAARHAVRGVRPSSRQDAATSWSCSSV